MQGGWVPTRRRLERQGLWAHPRGCCPPGGGTGLAAVWPHGVQESDGHSANGRPNRQSGTLTTPDSPTRGPSAAPDTCPIPALSLALSATPGEGYRRTAHPIGSQSSVCHSDWSRGLTPLHSPPPAGRLGHTIKDEGETCKYQSFPFGMPCPSSPTCNSSAF